MRIVASLLGLVLLVELASSHVLASLRPAMALRTPAAAAHRPAAPAITMLAAKKKVLLHAQRDYLPDGNQGMARETLSYSPMEWEVICLTVCQQLALTYDKLVKGARKLERG